MKSHWRLISPRWKLGELEGAEKKWNQLKEKATEIADDTVEISEEYIVKAKIVGEELKETYKRISKRLSE